MTSRLEAVLRAGEAHRKSMPTGGKKNRGAGYNAIMQAARKRREEDANKRTEEIRKRTPAADHQGLARKRLDEFEKRVAAQAAAAAEAAAAEAAKKAEAAAAKAAREAEAATAKAAREAARQARQAREAEKAAARAAKPPPRPKDRLEFSALTRTLDLVYKLDWFERKLEKEEAEGGAHEDTKASVAQLEVLVDKNWARPSTHALFVSMDYEYLTAWWAIVRGNYEEHAVNEYAALLNRNDPVRLERQRAVEALDREWASKMHKRARPPRRWMGR